MIPEIGQFAMILALLLAVAQSFFGIAGPWRGNVRWIQAVYPAVAGQFVLLGLAFGCAAPRPQWTRRPPPPRQLPGVRQRRPSA